MGGYRRASSRLAPFLRNAVSWDRRSCVYDGAVACTCRMSTADSSSAGSRDETENSASSSSQQVDEYRAFQPKPLRSLLSSTLAANLLRINRRSEENANPELQRRRNVLGLREEALAQTGRRSRLGSFGGRAASRAWLGRRYWSSDAHSNPNSKRRGLAESQIGPELFSEIEAQSSSGLKLAHGEVLSLEERAALMLAEDSEFGRTQNEEPVSVESIQEMLKELLAVADGNDPRVAIVSLKLGQEYEARGEDPKTFLKLGKQALSVFKTAGEFAAELSLEVAMCYHLIAVAHHRLGQQVLSLENLNKAVLVLSGKEGKESAPVRFAVQFLLGDTLAALGKHEDALQHYVLGLAVQETLLEKGHPQLASNYRQVGEAFTQVMMFDEARNLVEKALEIHVTRNGNNSVDEAIDRRLLSVIYSGLEEHEKALKEQLSVKFILSDKNLGSEALFVEIAIADTQVTLGRIDDAIATLGNVMSNLEEGSPLRVLATVKLSKAYIQQGNQEKAGEYSRLAITLLDSQLEGSNGEDTDLLTLGECYAELAAIRQRMKQPEEAIALLKKGLFVYKQLPQQMNAIAGSQAQIGMLLLFSGKAQEAIPYMEESAANLRHSYGDGHFSLALVLNHLAVAHVELENPKKAVALFEESKGLLTKAHGSGQQDTLAVYYNLMKIYASMGRRAEAIANAKHIVLELEKHGEAAKNALADAQQDLAALESSQSDISSLAGTQQLSRSLTLQAEDSVL